jgi:hypothetical protein
MRSGQAGGCRHNEPGDALGLEENAPEYQVRMLPRRLRRSRSFAGHCGSAFRPFLSTIADRSEERTRTSNRRRFVPTVGNLTFAELEPTERTTPVPQSEHFELVTESPCLIAMWNT